MTLTHEEAAASKDELTTRQIVFPEPGKVVVEETAAPGPPGAGEMLLATSHVGVCGSDIAALTGCHPWFRPPLVTGHEVTAHVAAIGPEVTDFAVGDPVLLNPLLGCGHCTRCQQGRPNQCAAAAVRGFKLPGAARSHLLVKATQVHHMSASLDLAEATLAEPLAAAWRAATRWHDLERVAVIGAGSIGQLVSCAGSSLTI
jgi:threonine dehydrogenase-like Zn-dependent dehydrogenase